MLGIDPAALELLEAAGFVDAETLAKANVDGLVKELVRANALLAIMPQAPTRDDVEQWIGGACEQTGWTREPLVVAVPKISAQVAVQITPAAFAIPLPGSFLAAQQVAVADIPAAIFLSQDAADFEVAAIEPAAAAPVGRVVLATIPIRLPESGGPRLDIDHSRIKSTDTLAGPAVRPLTAATAKDNERVSLIRGPLAETNRGRDPQSRRFIRGVMHSHPFSITLGACFTLLLALLLPLAILSSLLLLLSQELPATFGWVPVELLGLPLSLPAIGLGYLIWGVHGKCRICNQRIFVPRMCLKNSKAHQLPGLGYIIPVCLHLLLFRWFRCSYCGTPVRLKK